MAKVISVDVNVKYDEREFNQLLLLLCSVMNKSMADVIKHTARMFCKDMVQYTPPFSGSGPSSQGRSGMDSVARKNGQKKVSSQIRRIFAPLAEAPAQQVAEFGNLRIFSAWMDAKRALPEPHMPSWIFERFKSGAFISQGEFDLFKEYSGKKNVNRTAGGFWFGTTESQVKSLHQAVRGKPTYNVKETNHKVYVDDWKVVERYINRVQQRVGRLKSGWYYAGRALGKMPDIAWVSGQGSQDKICVQNLIGNTPSITVGTQGRERYRRWWPLMQLAINHRAFVMRKQIVDLLSKTKNESLRQVIPKLQKGFTIKDV